MVVPMTTVPAHPDLVAGQKRRVPFWDNARWFSITLVVIGHGIQRLTGESDPALAVYLFIYAFHIPAFAMISGYFSKASPPGSRQMKKIITDILLPYVIMQSIWTVVQYFAEGSTSINPTTPHWTLWFLLALGIFRLVLPYLVLLRWPLVWAVAFSIGVGYFSNVDSTFSLSRAIGILPFFLLGWQLRQWKLADKWHVLNQQAWLVRGIAIAVFAVWGVTVVMFLDFWRSISLHWFFYDDSYGGLGRYEWWAGFVRLGLMVLAVILSGAFFVLIPRSNIWITRFGQSTMYVYLLHSFILYPLRETGFLAGLAGPSLWLIAVIIACILISIGLSTRFIRTIFRPLIEPRPNWLFISLDDKPARPWKRDPTGSHRDN